jgi:hypothetical protein
MRAPPSSPPKFEPVMEYPRLTSPPDGHRFGDTGLEERLFPLVDRSRKPLLACLLKYELQIRLLQPRS